jgi:hypothetical protein
MLAREALAADIGAFPAGRAGLYGPTLAQQGRPLSHRKSGELLPTAVSNTRAASAHGGSAANNSAPSYGCTAAVNCAASSVGSPAAILISRVTIAAARIAAAGYDCSAADNRPTANGRSTAISRSTANCGAPVDAAPSGGSSLSLQSLAIYRDTIWKD